MQKKTNNLIKMRTVVLWFFRYCWKFNPEYLTHGLVVVQSKDTGTHFIKGCFK